MEHHAAELGQAVREDHERIRDLLAGLHVAWAEGRAAGVRRQFHRIEAAVGRHLRWEEHDLIAPLRERITLLYQHQVMQRDSQAHRDLRDAMARIHELLSARSRSGPGADHRILEALERLEVLLESHRSLFEAHVCMVGDELHLPAAHAGLARGLRAGFKRRMQATP
jgi:ribosomal protein S15P/S13E